MPDTSHLLCLDTVLTLVENMSARAGQVSPMNPYPRAVY